MFELEIISDVLIFISLIAGFLLFIVGEIIKKVSLVVIALILMISAGIFAGIHSDSHYHLNEEFKEMVSQFYTAEGYEALNEYCEETSDDPVIFKDYYFSCGTGYEWSNDGLTRLRLTIHSYTKLPREIEDSKYASYVLAEIPALKISEIGEDTKIPNWVRW